MNEILSLGDRMKGHENELRNYIPEKSYTIFKVDEDIDLLIPSAGYGYNDNIKN